VEVVGSERCDLKVERRVTVAVVGFEVRGSSSRSGLPASSMIGTGVSATYCPLQLPVSGTSKVKRSSDSHSAAGSLISPIQPSGIKTFGKPCPK
jgi:hypothetical protein